jgi:enterochelin esterase family protein
MIIVMPNGSVTLPGLSTFVPPQDRDKPAALAARIVALSKMHDAFVQDLLKCIIPHVEKNFRVLTNRENRAMAGLSMGGAETLRVAPSHLDLFSHIAVFSQGLQKGYTQGVADDFEERNAAFFSNPQQTNKLLKLFWIGVGSNDRTVFNGPKLLSETLNRHGIKNEYHESDGGHTWINWRRYLNEFLPRLFQ